MNKSAREAVFRNKGMIRDLWDRIDLLGLILGPFILSLCIYFCGNKLISYIFVTLSLLFVVFAVISHFKTGRLYSISKRGPSERNEIEMELSELGYRVIDKGSYFMKMVRNVKFTKNLFNVVLFWWNGDLVGYAWMDGGVRMNRMPFVTGRTEINRVKRKLSDCQPVAGGDATRWRS